MRFVEQGIDGETEKFCAKGHWPAVRGSEKFVNKAHLHSNASSKEVSRERKVVATGVILALASRKHGCNKAELLVATTGVDNTGRAMAMKLCQEYGSMKLGQIGKHFGLGSDSGVTQSISRLTHRMVDDHEVKGVHEVLCQDLTPLDLLSDNLLIIQQRLREGSYQPGAYRHFTIAEPKPRNISAIPFPDRVVHHALCNIIEPGIDKTFISTSFANRRGKGTHRAINCFQENARRYRYVLRTV